MDGTAANPGDYTVTTALTSITIPSGRSSATGTLTLTPAADSVVEGDETISVSGTSTLFTVSPATITLTDGDSAELSVTGPGADVDEGGDAEFTVSLSAPVDAGVTVEWSATGGTASAGDYSPASGSATFAANSAAGATTTIAIAVADDMLSETSETFTVSLGAIASDLSGRVSLDSSNSSATATIAASDPITVSLSGPASVDEAAAAAYTVSLSPAGVTPTADLTVSYATADGSATSGEDYAAASGTLTFTRADHADKSFTVRTTEDTLSELDETFSVALSNPSGGGGPAPSLGSSSSITTTITDDDDAPASITLSVDPATIGEGAGQTDITVTAALDGSSTLATSTVVTITLDGTAANPGDYTVTTALTSITIPSGRSSATGTLTLTPAADSVVEGDETISVSGTSTLFTVSPATITLTDGDSAELSVTGPGADVDEGSDAEFTVSLSAPVDAGVTVEWSATGGTASAGDYSPASGSATFAANSAAGATATIAIAVADDMLSETSETFTVSLGAIASDLSGRVSLDSSNSSATATIAASDPITVSLSGPASVDEGAAAAAYTVSLSPAGVTPTADLTVSYATADGSATSGEDYAAASGTLTFTRADHADKSFTVRTTEDTLSELDETFSVSISGPFRRRRTRAEPG